MHLRELSWEQRRQIYIQLAKEAKDRIEAKCRRLYRIYWLEKEQVASEFVRCDWCTRPRKQAAVYLPYKFYLCLDHFHQYDKERKKSKSYRDWAARKKIRKEAEELQRHLDRGVTYE